MDDGTEAVPLDDGPDWADDSTPLLPEDCRERSVDFFFGRSSCCIVRTMSHERQCGPRSPQADKGTEGEMRRVAHARQRNSMGDLFPGLLLCRRAPRWPLVLVIRHVLADRHATPALAAAARKPTCVAKRLLSPGSTRPNI